MKRRVFIKGVGYVSLGLIFSTMLGGCESLLEQIKNRPVRRRLRTGSAEVDHVIATYKDAVNQMEALPSSNPCSWAAQAAIHGTVSGGFNFCQHGTDHFFSWHRAYLVYFERICRELTGEKKFGLPYWNWNQNPAMHPEFTNASSPLFHPRNNISVAGNPAFSNGTMNTIFADNNFFTFSSQIEGTPHNTAHVVIGGDMVTGGGNPATATAGITTLMTLLSYRYEASAVGGFSAAMDLTARSAEELKKIETRLRKGANIRFEIKKRVPIVKGARLTISKPYSVATQVSADDFNTLIESDRRAERIFLRINYAQLPPVNDFFVRVFINLANANAQTPTDDVHFAGSFAFFGTHTGGRGDHHPKTDFLVSVTETLQNLKRQDQLKVGTPLSVQLVAVPATEQFIRADTELTLEEVEFIVSPVIVPPK